MCCLCPWPKLYKSPRHLWGRYGALGTEMFLEGHSFSPTPNPSHHFSRSSPAHSYTPLTVTVSNILTNTRAEQTTKLTPQHVLYSHPNEENVSFYISTIPFYFYLSLYNSTGGLVFLPPRRHLYHRHYT